MEHFTYSFNEDIWNIYLIEDNDDVITDEDVAALTKFEDKELYFRRSEISKEIIIHELTHVYFGYCFLADTNEITLADAEEIFAALLSHKYYRIGQVTNELYQKLIELRDKKTKGDNND